MRAKYSISRVTLVCWVATILMLGGCFMVFIFHQKYQDFQQTSRLLRLQQDQMMSGALVDEVKNTVRIIAIARKMAPPQEAATLAPALLAMLREARVGIGPGRELMILGENGVILLAPEGLIFQDHLKTIAGILATETARRVPAGEMPAGELSLGGGTLKLRWRAQALRDLPWQVCILGDLRHVEHAVSANLNRLRVDIMVEGCFLLLVALLVTAAAARFAYVIAKVVNREVKALTDFCQVGLREDVVLPPEDFQFREFAAIGAAATAMVHQIRDLLAELKRVAIRSTIANQSQSAVLASVSHDLRSRLNGILGMAQMMQAEPGTAEERHRRLETIVGSGKAIASLLEDVGYTCVLDTDDYRASRRACHLPRIREQVVGAVHRAAADHHHALEWVVGPGVPDWIISDQHLLRQVLLNLVEIGIYGPGEGLVRVEINNEGRVGSGEMAMRFTVNLRGAAITATEIDEIQCFPHVSRRYATISLRVAICRRMTELLGGRFELKMIENRDLFAEVRFATEPTAPPAEFRVAVGPSPASTASLRLKVLLVEDDPVSRDVVARMLRHFGIEVTTAEDGHTALTLVRQNPAAFDLVFMDCEMPIMDGYAATREIRRQTGPGERHLPVVALTGYAMPEDEARCREAGMDEYLTKPIAVDELRAMLERFAPRN